MATDIRLIPEVSQTASGKRAVTLRRKPVARTMLTHPGVYCLRSNETDWSEERLPTGPVIRTRLAERGDAPGTAAEGHPRCLGNHLLSRRDTYSGRLRGTIEQDTNVVP